MFKFTITVIQLLIITQCTISKEIPNNSKVTPLTDHYIKNDLRDLTSAQKRPTNELWNVVKQTAVHAWNSIKISANDTKNKTLLWINNVKSEAIRITVGVEERLKSFKSKINNVVQHILGKGEIVKKCLQKENTNIDNILKKIVKEVTKCISDKIKTLSKLEENYRIILNDTDFIGEVESKLDKCEKMKENNEECFFNLSREILEETYNTEIGILNAGVEARRKTDDILDAILSCSTEGLLNASSVIASEVVEIIRCVFGRDSI